jgi:hypothetical protein
MSSNDTGPDGVWLAMMGSPTLLDAYIGAKNTQVVCSRPKVNHGHLISSKMVVILKVILSG